MPDDPLDHPVWHALTSDHAPFAEIKGQARCYPMAMAPFGAVQELTQSALSDFASLIEPAASVYLFGERPPEHPNLRWSGAVPCIQMAFPAAAPLPPVTNIQTSIEPLNCSNAAEMLALISVAYPGYFRLDTCRMGRYWGIRDTDGTLIAMGGERLILSAPNQPVWREISGLCTHPSHPGKGLGNALLCHILAEHRAEGSASWLYVTEQNVRAAALYQRLGFQTLRHVSAHRMQRVGDQPQ